MQSSVYNSHNFTKERDIKLGAETRLLLEKASLVYQQNFKGKTWYGRCIFLSWYCSLGDCTFCFRSTQKHKIKHPSGSRRSVSSVSLEALFCRHFNWRIEFLTGGYGMMPFSEFLEYVKAVVAVYGEKIWLNIGLLSPEQLEELVPYVKGICASMETLHPELHTKVCPSKPIASYDKMLSAIGNRFKKSIAVIVGLGDTLEDMEYLFVFVEKHNLDRVTLYALKPVKGTEFTRGPSVEEYVQWIARLRIRFPKLEIIAGTNLRRSEEVGYLLRAGANAITKFPALKQFGTKKAKLIDSLIRNEGRDFISNFVNVPTNIDWDKEIESLGLTEKYKPEMKKILSDYLLKFSNPEDVDGSMLEND